jgi:hypothetical protein
MTASKGIHCPICGFLCYQRKDPKHSGMGPSAEIELLNHLNVYHLDEIKVMERNRARRPLRPDEGKAK